MQNKGRPKFLHFVGPKSRKVEVLLLLLDRAARAKEEEEEEEQQEEGQGQGQEQEQEEEQEKKEATYVILIKERHRGLSGPVFTIENCATYAVLIWTRKSDATK